MLDKIDYWLTERSGPVRMVLDTDTYNEIDDQFAVVYALLSPEAMNVEAIYAAPFHNSRSSGPADGMEKSYTEILRLLELMGVPHEGLVLKGSNRFMEAPDRPVESAAAADLVARAKHGEPPLYVAAIGAITNVASALLLDPAIAKRIVVVWLGGQGLHWRDTREFNLGQDLHAARYVLDCGVPLVRIPCYTAASHLLTTLPELERYVAGRGRIGDYLVDIFRSYTEDHFGYAKEIWDIATIAWLVNPDWVPTETVTSPILFDDMTWAFDASRHTIHNATYANRNAIFRDLFTKLGK